jgi:hypothetical protein
MAFTLVWSCVYVPHLAGVSALHRFIEGVRNRLVVARSVSSRVITIAKDSFSRLLLKFEAAIKSDQGIKPPLRQLQKLLICGPFPFKIGDGLHFVSCKELSNARVDVLIY